ncbi:uncharacterized protein BDW70DRAFT_159122 [Aspergillus foveolatus]|uniref:uncharacterized protein n=1 Tax=Aspergillus foveolatus TaxID=210207 RepID=UPI003CCD0BD5
MRLSKILATCTLALAAASGFQPEDIISRDVCILGGGATGSYAAVQLVEHGHSVAVLEQKDRLGGHSETLYLLNGVASEPISTIPLVNFRTGKRVYNEPCPGDPIPALLRYRAALEQFDYLSTSGYNLPDEVPEVLHRPFREFVEANDLHDALFTIWTFLDVRGDMLETRLLFVRQLFGTTHINGLLQGYIGASNGSATTFRAAARYIVKNSGISDGLIVVNTDPSKPGSFPVPPYEGILDYSDVSGYYRTRLAGNGSFTDEGAQQLVLDNLRRMGDAGTYPINEKGGSLHSSRIG